VSGAELSTVTALGRTARAVPPAIVNVAVVVDPTLSRTEKLTLVGTVFGATETVNMLPDRFAGNAVLFEVTVYGATPP
jgi:translation initiation factor 2 gamma subunit (eIF-2gamma)